MSLRELAVRETGASTKKTFTVFTCETELRLQLLSAIKTFEIVPGNSFCPSSKTCEGNQNILLVTDRYLELS